MVSLSQQGALCLPCLLTRNHTLRSGSDHRAQLGSTQLNVAPIQPRQFLPAAVASDALGRGTSLAAFRTFTADAASAVAIELSVATAALAIAAAAQPAAAFPQPAAAFTQPAATVAAAIAAAAIAAAAPVAAQLVAAR